MRKILLILLFAPTVLLAQLPPYLRTPFTTNADPVGVLGLATSNSLINAAVRTNRIFLEVNGNDATAIAGSVMFPFRTWTNAVAAIRNNTTLHVGPGDYLADTKGTPSQTISQSNGPAASVYFKTNISIIFDYGARIVPTNNCNPLCFWGVEGFYVEHLNIEWTNTLSPATLTNLYAAFTINGPSRNGLVLNPRFTKYPDHAIWSDSTYQIYDQTNVWIVGGLWMDGGNTNAVQNDGAGIVPGSHWRIINPTFRRCFRGIELYRNPGSVSLVGVVVDGGTFDEMHGEAMTFINGDGLNRGFVDCRLTHNLVLPFSSVGPDRLLKAGIAGIHGGIYRCHLENNIVDGTTTTTLFGITLQTESGNAGGSSDIEENVIAGNDIYLPLSAGIYMADASNRGANITNNIIRQNHVKRAQSTGIQVSGGWGNFIEHNFLDNNLLADVYLNANARNNQVKLNTSTASQTALYFALGASNNVGLLNVFNGASVQAVQDLNLHGHNTLGPNYGPNAFSGTNDLGFDFVESALTTTDATVTTLYQFTPRANATARVVAYVTAYSGGSSQGAYYGRVASFKNLAGTVTQISTTSSILGTMEDDATWDATIDLSGSLVRVRVTGAAAKTIKWAVEGRVSYAQ